MTNRIFQHGFGAGEIAPSLFGRNELDQYLMGAARIENFIVMPQGAIRSRSGFRYVGTAIDSSKPVRLIPFRYSTTQSFILEFGDHTLRFIRNGSYLTNGDGTIYQISSPYDAENLAGLDYSQNADVITITSAYFPPYELRRYGTLDWRFVAVSVVPTISAPSGLSVTAINANRLSEEEQKDANKLSVSYVVTSVDADGYESLPSAAVSGTGNYYINGCKIRVQWNAVSGADHYRVYRYVSGLYGYIGYTSSTWLDDQGDNPDMTATPPKYRNVFSNTSLHVESISVQNGGKNYWYGDDGEITYLPDKIAITAIPPVAYNGEIKAVKFIIKDDTAKSILYSFDVPFTVVTNNGYSVAVKTGTDTQTVFTLGTGKTAGLVTCGVYIQTSDGAVSLAVKADGTTNNADVSFASFPDVIKAYSITDGINALLSSASWQEGGCELADVIEHCGYAGGTAVIPLEIYSTAGKGARAYANASNGVIVSAVLTAQGSNYADATVAANNSVGSGAVFYAKCTSGQAADLPSCVTQFEQRRVFAGSIRNPLKVWFTNAGYQNLMMYHLPTQNDDRIEMTAVTSDADIIKHMAALESLLLFTGSSELRVYTQNSDALTPNSVAVKAQSYIGANDCQPVISGNYVIYCSARGGHMRALGYDYNQGGYISSDISIRAPHLFDGYDVVSIALTKAPVQCIWAVSSGGELLGCTYVPEQGVCAWHRHTTLDGTFECAAAISEGKEDHLYCVIKRNGKRLIERLDSYGVPSKNPVNRVLDGYLDGTFTMPQSFVSNLDHLNGETVAVYVDGVRQSDKVVNQGMITLDTAGYNIAVGLPVTAQLNTLPLVVSSTEARGQGRTKNVSEVLLRCAYTGKILAGDYPDGELWECKQKDIYLAPQDSNSYLLKVSLSGSWSQDAQIQAVHKDANMIEIQAVIYNISMEGGK